MVDFVTNDTGSIMRFTCVTSDTGAAINLSGATVVARWEDDLGVIVTKPMTITDAPNGVCEYQFLTGEIVFPFFKVEIEITDAGGRITSNLELEKFTSREELG